MAQTWKKGRGKLGPMAPLIGSWIATADSPMGLVTCKREFARFGDGHIRLDAAWTFGKDTDKPYRELAIFTPGDAGQLVFRSFTNDGKASHGQLVKASDAPPDAVVFEAQMPAGLARQIYWPDSVEGFQWTVEAKTKKGWSRFTAHHYKAAP